MFILGSLGKSYSLHFIVSTSDRRFNLFASTIDILIKLKNQPYDDYLASAYKLRLESLSQS